MHNLSLNSVRFGVMFKQSMQGSAAALVALAIAGCAMSDSMRRPGDREMVAERAQERWDALVKGDFAAAYRYISPPGRTLVPQDAYASGLKKGFWTGAKVQNVQCPSSEACEVDVVIDYQHNGLKMQSPLREKWVKQNSNWWFVL
jgi:hypothetical protein